MDPQATDHSLKAMDADLMASLSVRKSFMKFLGEENDRVLMGMLKISGFKEVTPPIWVSAERIRRGILPMYMERIRVQEVCDAGKESFDDRAEHISLFQAIQMVAQKKIARDRVAAERGSDENVRRDPPSPSVAPSSDSPSSTPAPIKDAESPTPVKESVSPTQVKDAESMTLRVDSPVLGNGTTSNATLSDTPAMGNTTETAVARLGNNLFK